MITATGISAVILDLDGTLLDTAADLAAAANAIRVDEGLHELPAERITRFVGRGADALVHRALSDSLDGVVDDETFTRGRAAFDRHYQRENGRWAKPYTGVMTGLKRLAERRFPMACVTNKPQAFADPLLYQHGMAQFFQVTLGGDALDRRKPDPAPLLHAAGLMQVDPASCLMVGDSVNDATAARAAGMPVVILPYGYNEGRSVQTIDCDGIVESIEAVADLLAGDQE